MPNPARLRARLRHTRLRTRILAGVLAVALVVLAGFGIAAVTFMRRYLLAETDENLRTTLTEYYAYSQSTAHDPAAHLEKQLPGAGQHLHGSFQVPAQASLDPALAAVLSQYDIEFMIVGGRLVPLVAGKSDLVPRLPADLAQLAARGGTQTVTSESGGAQLRLAAKPVADGTLIITESLKSVDSTLSRLKRIVVLGLLASGILVLAGVGLVVRRGFRPLVAMASAADALSAGDLTRRVSPYDSVTEVGRLGAALNGMLNRVQAAVRQREASEQAARQFLADASHELRTPLASLRANAELYQQGALSSGPQTDEAMRRISTEARRMGVLVDDMMRLARLEQHPGQDHEPVNISALALECAQRARTTSPRHAWQSRIADGLVTVGDEEMLRRAIDNLLTNIAEHTPAGTAATITAWAADDVITVEVSDDGPGVQADQLPRIFERFYRAPVSGHRTGSGLGLAIVTAVAVSHHGTARAALNHPHGLRVTLTLPEYRQSFTARPPARDSARFASPGTQARC